MPKPKLPQRPAGPAGPAPAGREPPRARRPDRATALVFDPLAWLKLQFFCHAGPTEIGGLAICKPDNPLHVTQFVPLRQRATAVSVAFDDDAVAEHFDQCVDDGLKPEQFARVWLHTHPGESADPSMVDEATFARVFGPCDWAVMAILSRTGRTYCRLRFNTGPGADVLLPVCVDWSAWPELASGAVDLSGEVATWVAEYRHRVQTCPLELSGLNGAEGSWPRWQLLQCLGDDEQVLFQQWLEDQAFAADQALEWPEAEIGEVEPDEPAGEMVGAQVRPAVEEVQP